MDMMDMMDEMMIMMSDMTSMMNEMKTKMKKEMNSSGMNYTDKENEDEPMNHKKMRAKEMAMKVTEGE